LLVAPYAFEELSPMDGPGVVLLDLAETNESDASLWQVALLDQLKRLPCITIAIEAELSNRDAHEGASRRALALACDVALTVDHDLDAFLDGFKQTPIAALAFAQLLRSSPAGSVHAGLLAESFAYSTLQSGTEFKEWLAARARDHGVKRRVRRRGKPLDTESRTPADSACRLERDEGRLTITLNRPGRHNAFSRAMRDSLVEALQLAMSDSSIEDVLLRGEGPSFCSGGDLDEFGTADDPASAHVVRTTRSPAQCVAQLAGRIGAEVHGACIGAGVELPAFMDRVIAREDAYFQLPEIAMGLIPGAGGTVSLPRRIGRQRTAWLGLSGQRIDVERALAWGLVDEVRLGQPVVRRSLTERE
jgi:enoyl-CoA hydratase/carnithine racemase